MTVDQGTGAVTLRAVFPNDTGLLLPGMFVREQLQEGIRQNGILAPQQGVTHNARGEATALVVGADGKVQSRILTTDRAIGNDWLVTKGLDDGDRLIVERRADGAARDRGDRQRGQARRRPRRLPSPSPDRRQAGREVRHHSQCHVSSSTARSLPGFWPSS